MMPTSKKPMRIVYNRLQNIQPRKGVECFTVFIKKPTRMDKHHQVFGKKTDDKVSYALDFTPWSEWLTFKIHSKTVSTYSHDEIVAHCLWEMTYYGNEVQTRTVARLLKKAVAGQYTLLDWKAEV